MIRCPLLQSEVIVGGGCRPYSTRPLVLAGTAAAATRESGAFGATAAQEGQPAVAGSRTARPCSRRPPLPTLARRLTPRKAALWPVPAAVFGTGWWQLATLATAESHAPPAPFDPTAHPNGITPPGRLAPQAYPSA